MSDFAKLKTLTRSLSFEDTLIILAMQAAASVNDMQSDYMQDPDFVKENGLPTKAQLISHAVDYLVNVMPDMVDGSGQIPNSGADNKEESPLVQLLRDAVAHVYAQDGSFSKLNYTAR